MKTSWKLALVFLLVVLFFWSRSGDGPKAPDKQLVRHFDHMCKIAERGIETPHRGVQKLFAYYGKNSPDMLKQFGVLLVTIERIKDDEAHDKRAALASRRMGDALAKCERTYQRFANAIEDDPEATRLLEHGANRFARTLEILFGGNGRQVPTSIEGVQRLLHGVDASI